MRRTDARAYMGAAADAMLARTEPAWVAVGQWLDSEMELWDRFVHPVPEVGGHLFCNRCDEGFALTAQCWCWDMQFNLAKVYTETEAAS